MIAHGEDQADGRRPAEGAWKVDRGAHKLDNAGVLDLNEDS